jgi:hypothetical protein
MQKRRCAGCRRVFRPRAQVPKQRYCSAAACQRVRRQRWQREKRRTDADYRENQAQAQRRWAERHPGYWCRYRAAHPAYTAANRSQQRERDRRRRGRADNGPVLARSDASRPVSAPPSGTYRLIPVTVPRLAKRDGWTVKIHAVSTG